LPLPLIVELIILAERNAATPRLLLRRLVGPLTLWDAAVTPALLEGLVHHVASPAGLATEVPAIRGPVPMAA
jgi:hypothetical protein